MTGWRGQAFTSTDRRKATCDQAAGACQGLMQSDEKNAEPNKSLWQAQNSYGALRCCRDRQESDTAINFSMAALASLSVPLPVCTDPQKLDRSRLPRQRRGCKKEQKHKKLLEACAEELSRRFPEWEICQRFWLRGPDCTETCIMSASRGLKLALCGVA